MKNKTKTQTDNRSSEELVQDMGRALFPKFTYILDDEKHMLALAAAVSYMIKDIVTKRDVGGPFTKFDRPIDQHEIVEMWRREFNYLLED